MIKAINHVSPIFVAMYGAIALLYVLLLLENIRKMRKIVAMDIVKEVASTYNYMMGSSIASALMAIRSVVNIFICDGTAITVLRIVASGMVAYTLYMGTRGMWQSQVQPRYNIMSIPKKIQ